MSRRNNTRGAGRRGSSARPWNPAWSLPSYLLFEGDYGVTIDGSTRVSSWADKIRNYPITQATPASRPLYAAADATANGRPTVTWDTSGALVLTGADTLNMPHPFSSFEYSRYDGAGTFGHRITRSDGRVSQVANRTAGVLQHYAYDNTNFQYAPNTLADVAAGTKRSIYREMRADQTVINTLNATTTVSATNARLPAAFAMQSVGLGYTTSSMTGPVLVYAIFLRGLTAAELTDLHNWCVAKYG